MKKRFRVQFNSLFSEIEQIKHKVGNIKFNFSIFNYLKILRLISRRVLEESRYTI